MNFLMKGPLFRPSAFPPLVVLLLLILAATTLPLLAQSTNAAPAAPSATSADDFGQYLADHESDLAPFFADNAGDIFKQGLPVFIGMLGWVILFSMLLGWGLDILLSRGFAFFFAPAFAEWKRAVIYATGQLFLSFVYKCLMGIAIVFSLNLTQAFLAICIVVGLLMLVEFAAQVVWVLYLYRTSFTSSLLFYLLVIVVQIAGGFLLAGPFLGTHAPGSITRFIDSAITPRLQAGIDSARHDVASAQAESNAAKSRTNDILDQVSQAQAEKERLTRQIEEKKNSDIYILAQVLKVRANGDLTSARDQLAAFPSKFPSSPLNTQVRAQLSDVDNQLAMAALQQKQQQADSAREAATARADLLDRAGKGEVTLSEMRQALINKTRAQVKELLGAPSDTGPDSWGYRRQMIVNPLTNEKHGLMIYFSEGLVQGVDYDRNGGSR